MGLKKLSTLAAAVIVAGLACGTAAQAAMNLNGMMLNGFNLNGIALNGLYLNAFHLNGFNLNGTEAQGTRSEAKTAESFDFGQVDSVRVRLKDHAEAK